MIAREFYFPEFVTLHSFNIVIIGEHIVDDYVVRFEQVTDAAILIKQGFEGVVDFVPCRHQYAVVKFRIQFKVELEEFKPVEIQPLMSKPFYEFQRFRVVQHAVGLPFQFGRISQFTTPGCLVELFIRRCTPKKVGKSHGEFEIAEFPFVVVRIGFSQVEKSR